MAKKKKKNVSDNKDLAPVETLNQRLWFVVFGIAAFFVIMYMSKMFMPSRASRFDFGPIESNGETYLVASWQWDKNNGVMEIVYAMEGRYILTDDVSSRMAVKSNAGESRHDGEIVYQSENTIVMDYNGIKTNGTEFEVRLTVDINEPHFFNNKNEIEIVDEITAKSDAEYQKISRTAILNNYLKEIETKQEKIKNNEDEIAAKEEEIRSYKENAVNKTQAQLQEIDASIKKLETDITAINDTNRKLQEEITEYEERVENLRKEIDEQWQ